MSHSEREHADELSDTFWRQALLAERRANGRETLAWACVATFLVLALAVCVANRLAVENDLRRCAETSQ